MAAMGWPALVCELLRSKLALTLACGWDKVCKEQFLT